MPYLTDTVRSVSQRGLQHGNDRRFSAIFADSKPVAAPARITGLDVTRGFAVMGILAMNIVAFAMPEGRLYHPQGVGR